MQNIHQAVVKSFDLLLGKQLCLVIVVDGIASVVFPVAQVYAELLSLVSAVMPAPESRTEASRLSRILLS